MCTTCTTTTFMESLFLVRLCFIPLSYHHIFGLFLCVSLFTCSSLSFPVPNLLPPSVCTNGVVSFIMQQGSIEFTVVLVILRKALCGRWPTRSLFMASLFVSFDSCTCARILYEHHSICAYYTYPCDGLSCVDWCLRNVWMTFRSHMHVILSGPLFHLCVWCVP